MADESCSAALIQDQKFNYTDVRAQFAFLQICTREEWEDARKNAGASYDLFSANYDEAKQRSYDEFKYNEPSWMYENHSSVRESTLSLSGAAAYMHCISAKDLHSRVFVTAKSEEMKVTVYITWKQAGHDQFEELGLIASENLKPELKPGEDLSDLERPAPGSDVGYAVVFNRTDKKPASISVRAIIEGQRHDPLPLTIPYVPTIKIVPKEFEREVRLWFNTPGGAHQGQSDSEQEVELRAGPGFYFKRATVTCPDPSANTVARPWVSSLKRDNLKIHMQLNNVHPDEGMGGTAVVKVIEGFDIYLVDGEISQTVSNKLPEGVREAYEKNTNTAWNFT